MCVQKLTGVETRKDVAIRRRQRLEWLASLFFHDRRALWQTSLVRRQTRRVSLRRVQSNASHLFFLSPPAVETTSVVTDSDAGGLGECQRVPTAVGRRQENAAESPLVVVGNGPGCTLVVMPPARVRWRPFTHDRPPSALADRPPRVA